MVEDTSKNILLEVKNDGKQNTLQTIPGDDVQNIKQKSLSRSTSKDDSDENSSDLIKKIKRSSDGNLPIDAKKSKSDNADTPNLSEELFDWPTYLAETGSTKVKESFFKHIVPECMCGFEAGMKLEVPNKDYKNTYWLATIIAKASPLILVRYEGFQETNNADFWCNTLTDDIHPVGWCARSKHALKPPKAIQHQEKNWYAYLIKNLTGARKASENLFLKKSHPVHYLRAGHYVEVINQLNPTCYWLARIIEVYSGRLNLQYEGYEDKNSDFWCYYLNENLRPVGHGLKNALTLYPPKSLETISHPQFRRITEKLITLSRRTDNTVFKTIFQGWGNKTIHNLRLGMKLEAINPENPSEICVASVFRIFDPFHFLVKIDQLISIQQEPSLDSFVAHQGSPGIFPVGFCGKNGLTLQQPTGFIGKFSWDSYLKYTKTEAIDESFFTELNSSAYDISVGMKLEAVDKENPANICVCSVTKVAGGHVWLHVDGDTRDDQIFSFSSRGIYPVGWCQSTGHELQWPRPETLEQKNRISRLRHTATRKNRLEVLRKGKSTTAESSRETRKDLSPSKQKKNKTEYNSRGRRGVSRKRRIFNEDDKEGGTADTTIAFVCINRLAEEFNTEESIKKFYRLDSENRLPAQVVTIDDDDDDDEDEDGTEKKRARFTESDLNYLSFLRVKPKTLSKSESEMYEKKMSEHESSPTEDVEDFAHQAKKGRSLSSVVAMLTANKNQRPHLLEQYKQNKNKGEIKNAAFIDLSGDEPPSVAKAALANAIQPSADGSINIPGKGQFQIMEQIVTKEGDKNKIILRLGKSKQHPPHRQVAVMSPPDIKQQQQEKPPKYNTPNENISNPNVMTPVVDSLTRNMTSQQPHTHVNDLYTIEHMARSHKGLDEMLRNRFNKVHGYCKTLPRNPLFWDRNHVSMFIINADFEKYATNFYEQEIDGHSLLLLTVQELHHILGIRLGPAMKIHDLIYSLQQIVNEAYLASKERVLSKNNTTGEKGSTLPNDNHNNKTNDDVIKTTIGILSDVTTATSQTNKVKAFKRDQNRTATSKTEEDNHEETEAKAEEGQSSKADTPLDSNVDHQQEQSIIVASQPNNAENEENIPNEIENDHIFIEMEEPIIVPTKDNIIIAPPSMAIHHPQLQPQPQQLQDGTSDVKLSNEKVAKWIDTHNDALEKIRMETVGEFEKEYYGLLNAGYPPGANPYLSNVFRSKPLSAKKMKHPVRFIQIQQTPGAPAQPHGMMLPPGVRFIRMPQPPQTSPTATGNPAVSMPYIVQFGSVKDAAGVANHNGSAATNNGIKSETGSSSSSTRQRTKSGSTERRKRRAVEGGEVAYIKVPNLEGAMHIMPQLPANAQELYDKYLKDVKVDLNNKELWDDFYKTGTEMILTRNGRRMFPSLQLKLSGMSASAKYVVLVDFIPVDQCRYKFEYESTKWMVACEEGTPKPAQVYMHPFSPQYGFEWCRTSLNFLKCKLTNNLREGGGHILMQSMHKYQPRISILYWDGSLPIQITPHEMLRLCVKREYFFEETKFIAVTAYQNNQVTHLKIQSNPFARGFRGDWRKTKAKRNSNKNNTSLEDDEMYIDMQSDEEDSSDQINGSEQYENKENDSQEVNFEDTIIKVEPVYT